MNPTKAISFGTSRGRLSLDVKNLATLAANLTVHEQVQAICGVYDLGPPWEWHLKGVMHKNDETSPKCFTDAGHLSEFVTWYISVVTQFETDLVAATGRGMMLKNREEARPS